MTTRTRHLVSLVLVASAFLDPCQSFSVDSIRGRPQSAIHPSGSQCFDSNTNSKNRGTTTRRRISQCFSTSQDDEESELPPPSETASSTTDQQSAHIVNTSTSTNGSSSSSSSSSIRQRVGRLARNIVVRPIYNAYAMPKAVAEVLKDATISAVDMAVEEVFSNRNSNNSSSSNAASRRKASGIEPIGETARLQERLDQIRMNRERSQGGDLEATEALLSNEDIDMQAIVDEAFAPMEQSLNELEQALIEARKAHEVAKSQALQAMEAIQAAATAQAEAAITTVERAEQVAERVALVDFYAQTNFLPDDQEDEIIRSLADVDFATSEMAPPFLDEASCLVPGEPVVRVEKAPENSRRIFAGIDIMADLEHVWNVLTDYENLEKVVPNLLVNDVLKLHDGVPMQEVHVDLAKPDNAQCKEISEQMKGAELRQVGGAKVVGINFSARTTLEVREWPQGLPDFAHFQDDVWEGKSRKERARDYTQVPLERYQFPRPFAVSKLPTRDITMQSIEDDDGEFRMYQGVWRMQPLPGCAQNGEDAMRLTYAVEVSPRAYLPVQLIEGRIVKDLCNNLKAIRDYVEVHVAKSRTESAVF